MTIKVNLHIERLVVDGDNWQMFAAIPKTMTPDLKLNKYGNIALVGNNLSFITVGHDYDLILEPKENAKYGTNYEVADVPMLSRLDEITPEQNYNLMCEVTTPQQAKYVQEAYPDFVQLVLEGKENEIDVKKIYNVGKFYFEFYCREIQHKFSFFKIRANYKEYKFNDKECKALTDRFGNVTKVIQQIDEHPYRVLTNMLDRSFNQADKLLKEIRPELIESDERCECAMCSILQANELDGNTRMDAITMAKYTPESCRDLIPKMKSVAISSDWIYYDDPTKKISLASTYTNECLISDTLKMLLKHPNNLELDWENYKATEDIQLTDEQAELLRMANEENFCLLLGNAGSGKTSAVQALIHMLEENNLSYTLLAPTGIASKRLSEATHRNASTIHRRIGSFQMNTIDTNFVIIDEISMCGIEHLSMVCKAINPTYTKVIFVGDNAQLASIACGNILEDIVNSNKVPNTKLTKIFRYGKGSLTTVSTDIREGKPFVKTNGELCFIGAGEDDQFEFLPINRNPLEQILKVYDRLLETYHPEDILILSPFNKGDFGTRAINDKIQAKYNPETTNNTTVTYEHESFSINFRKKDRILNTTNNYNAKTFEQFEQEKSIKNDIIEKEEKEISKDVSIFNGDMGVIREIDEKDNAIVQIDENLIVFSKKDLKFLLLGNAVSIHKIQGSAAKAIILLTHSKHEKMMSNNLMYVGATRSKEKLIWIGDIQTINTAITIHETLHRDTWLLDLLQQPEYHLQGFEDRFNNEDMTELEDWLEGI